MYNNWEKIDIQTQKKGRLNGFIKRVRRNVLEEINIINH